MAERERRVIGAVRAEARADSPSGRVIVGHAAVFDRETDIGGMFREKIAPGAFARAIREGQDVRALVNHDESMLLGRSKAGTLRLEEDDVGLRVEIDLPDTTAARDLIAGMERGDIDQMSFGFIARREEWDDTQSPPLRTILDVDLFDVSVVTFPAYEETDASLRAFTAHREELERERNRKAAARRVWAKRLALRRRQLEARARQT